MSGFDITSGGAGGLDITVGANARLTAAAPLLLEACRRALAYDAAIQRQAYKGQSWVEGDDLDELYSAWINCARAAIAKATEHPRQRFTEY